MDGPSPPSLRIHALQLYVFFSHALFYMHVVIPFMLPTSITHSGGVLCYLYCCLFVFHMACSTCLGYTVRERRELVEIQSNKPSPSADNL